VNKKDAPGASRKRNFYKKKWDDLVSHPISYRSVRLAEVVGLNIPERKQDNDDQQD